MQEKWGQERTARTELKEDHDKLNAAHALTVDELQRTKQQHSEEQTKVSTLQTEIAKYKVG
jgi:hypothetical protein